MTGIRVCFPGFGQFPGFCVWVPFAYDPWPWPPREGITPPWIELLGEPSPDPWRQNLPILATVAKLAGLADGELKGRLQRMVEAELAEIQRQLPQGATVELQAPAR